MTKDQAAAAPDLLPGQKHAGLMRLRKRSGGCEMQLKNCPFCGGPAEHRKPYNRIECTSVECRPMPVVRARTLAEAVSHWNRRAPITPAVSEASPVEAVEAARRIVVVAYKWEANQISGQQYWHGLEGHLDAKSVIRLARALLSRASPSSEAARREAIEECAEKARSHLENWAGDLAATRDQYIDAAACGMFNGRRITEEHARLLARQFRERAEAVSESAEHTAKAIRSIK